MNPVKKIWRQIFGHDEFLNGEHIAHEPSYWQRRRARRQVADWVWEHIDWSKYEER